MKQEIKLGVTDRTVTVFIPDPASTDGSGKTGLVAANLTCSYTRVETDNDVVVTDVTSSLNNLSALTDAHNDWGLLEVSSTVAPGLYRLDIADAVFATGAWSAVVYVMITSSAAAASPMEFILVAYDPLDTVRLGLTALPNAAADAAGGLPISDAGGLDLDAKVGALTYTVANKVDANVTHAAGTAWGSGAITAGVIAADAIGASELAADAVAEIADAVWDEDATAHQTGGTFGQAIGDPGADTNTIFKAVVTDAAGATVGVDVVSIQADTDNIQTRLPAALVSGRMDSDVGAMQAATITAAAVATGAIDADALAADAGTEIAAAVLTSALTESYAADGAAPTLAQAVFAIQQFMQEKSISGTTLTVKKLDGSTTAMTFTLNSATAPTSVTRAT